MARGFLWIFTNYHGHNDDPGHWGNVKQDPRQLEVMHGLCMTVRTGWDDCPPLPRYKSQEKVPCYGLKKWGKLKSCLQQLQNGPSWSLRAQRCSKKAAKVCSWSVRRLEQLRTAAKSICPLAETAGHDTKGCMEPNTCHYRLGHCKCVRQQKLALSFQTLLLRICTRVYMAPQESPTLAKECRRFFPRRRQKGRPKRRKKKTKKK